MAFFKCSLQRQCGNTIPYCVMINIANIRQVFKKMYTVCRLQYSHRLTMTSNHCLLYQLLPIEKAARKQKKRKFNQQEIDEDDDDEEMSDEEAQEMNQEEEEEEEDTVQANIDENDEKFKLPSAADRQKEGESNFITSQ